MGPGAGFPATRPAGRGNTRHARQPDEPAPPPAAVASGAPERLDAVFPLILPLVAPSGGGGAHDNSRLRPAHTTALPPGVLIDIPARRRPVLARQPRASRLPARRRGPPPGRSPLDGSFRCAVGSTRVGAGSRAIPGTDRAGSRVGQRGVSRQTSAIPAAPRLASMTRTGSSDRGRPSSVRRSADTRAGGIVVPWPRGMTAGRCRRDEQSMLPRRMSGTRSGSRSLPAPGPVDSRSGSSVPGLNVRT